MKKLIIAGGTGFLGEVLLKHFENQFEKIVILTRGNSIQKGKVDYIQWNTKALTGWEAELEDATVLINLAGESVDCRYSDKNKKKILSSRIDSTEILNLAILQCKNPPQHWLNSSTATIYRHSEDKEMSEQNGEIGNDFSENVAKDWENTFFKTETPLTIKTAMRTSIVLGKNGGAFLPLKKLTQLGFGGKQGNGNQFISWIHEKDFARALEFILKNKIKGIVNIVAPNPVTNSEFMCTLKKALNVPIAIPTPKSLLKFGAFLISTEAELVLKSRNVVPERLLQQGYSFDYDEIRDAFKQLLS